MNRWRAVGVEIIPTDFKDRVVVVTGGSSGIGHATAAQLLALGATVVVTGHDGRRLEQARLEFARTTPNVDAEVFDIRNSTEVERGVAAILARRGRIDVLVNNAGYAVYRSFEESALSEIVDLVDVNLTGAMRVARAVLPSMIARRSGCIVNVSSIGGQTIITPNAVYCAAKHGLVAWTRALRYELEPFNITANVVCPGFTVTHFHDHETFRRRDAYRRAGRTPMDADVVARVILDAIRYDRPVSYAPRWLALATWALNCFSFVTRPAWDRIARRRVAQLYEQIEIERDHVEAKRQPGP